MRSMVWSSRSIDDAQSWTGVRRALGRQVRKLRTAQGLSQEQLGERADLHWTHISGIERAQYDLKLSTADPRVTRPRGELGGTLRRDCCAASTSEALTLRGHGCSFLEKNTSVIEGSFDISEVDVHLCRGCAIAAPESLASCRCRCRRTRTVCVGPRESVGGTGGAAACRTKA